MRGPTLLSSMLSLVVVAVAALGAGCGSTPYEERRRDYQLPVELEQIQDDRSDGSLWSRSASSNYFFSDQRAVRLGDLVTVRVEEYANAQRGAQTRLSRESDFSAEIENFLGLMERLADIDENIDPSSLIDASMQLSFAGSGETSRTESLDATVQAMVRQVLPNGNLFIEGYRVVTVNNEEQYLYVSGVARAHDINENNEISSSLLADANIEFTGSGALSDQQRPGWLTQALGFIWPF